MLILADALHAWGTPEFERRFKEELERVPADQLPLQQALALTSHVSSEPFGVSVISVHEEPSAIRVKTGVFYSGIIAGCSCADDPTPIDTVTEHCELQLDIDKRSGATTVTLLPS